MRLEEVDPERIVPLRHAVLRPNRPIEEVRYATDRAPGAFHVAAFDADALIGCATALPSQLPGREGPAYQLRGMAVLDDYRNEGIGALLLERIEDEVRSRGIPLMWCNGRLVAGNFYRRHGWVEEGEEFDLVGIPHKVFVKPLG